MRVFPKISARGLQYIFFPTYIQDSDIFVCIAKSPLKWSGSFYNIVIFFIESSSVKKNLIIKLFEPSERGKYVFCGLKSRS